MAGISFGGSVPQMPIPNANGTTTAYSGQIPGGPQMLPGNYWTNPDGSKTWIGSAGYHVAGTGPGEGGTPAGQGSGPAGGGGAGAAGDVSQVSVAPPPGSLTKLSDDNAPSGAGSAGTAAPSMSALSQQGSANASEGWGLMPATPLDVPGGRSVPPSSTALAQLGAARGRIY